MKPKKTPTRKFDRCTLAPEWFDVEWGGKPLKCTVGGVTP